MRTPLIFNKRVRTNSTTPSSIVIDTTNASTVNKDLWSTCAVDISFTGGNVHNFAYKEINTTAFQDLISQFNFNSFHYSGGSTSNVDQVIVGETTIASGNGYNCTGNCSYLDECCPDNSFGHDFYLALVQFCKTQEIGLNFIANTQIGDNAGVQTDWADQLQWKIQHAEAEGVQVNKVIFGMEQPLASNDNYWLGYSASTTQDYIDKTTAYTNKVVPVMNTFITNFPNITFDLDNANIEQTSNRFAKWKLGVQGFNNDGFRQYFNLTQFAPVFTSDYDANLVLVNSCISTLNTRLASCLSAYPTKKISIWQYGLRNTTGGSVNIEDTMLGLITIAKMMKAFLVYNNSNSNVIEYASYQDLKQVVDNSTDSLENKAYALIAIGKLFQNTPLFCTTTIDSNILGTDIEGISIKDGNTTRLLIINQGSSTKTLTSITVNNRNKTSFTRYSYYASSLDSTTISTDNGVVESTLQIKPFSINIVEI